MDSEIWLSRAYLTQINTSRIPLEPGTWNLYLVAMCFLPAWAFCETNSSERPPLRGTTLVPFTLKATDWLSSHRPDCDSNWGHYFDGFWVLSKSENGIGCFPLTHH